jgi:hypothetical protein
MMAQALWEPDWRVAQLDRFAQRRKNLHHRLGIARLQLSAHSLALIGNNSRSNLSATSC